MVVPLMGEGRRKDGQEPQADENGLEPAQGADGNGRALGRPRNMSKASGATRLMPVARLSDAGGSRRSLEAALVDAGADLAFGLERLGEAHGRRDDVRAGHCEGHEQTLLQHGPSPPLAWWSGVPPSS